MTAKRRTTRPRKSDRLLSPGASLTQVEADHACAPLDRTSRDMDRKWGVDRLPDLVSPETAAKFGSAMAKLNAAIDADDPKETRIRAEVCMRGLQAMDREAEGNGAPKPQTIVEYDLDGQLYGIVDSVAEIAVVRRERPEMLVFSVREVCTILRGLGSSGAMVKDVFPGAEISAVRPAAKTYDDPIPF